MFTITNLRIHVNFRQDVPQRLAAINPQLRQAAYTAAENGAEGYT